MDVFTSENIKLVSAAIGILTTLIFILKLLINSYKTSTLRKFVSDLCNLPSLIQIINNRQSKIFNEIRLQGKINTAIVDILDLAQSLYDSNGLCIKVNRKWVSITGMPESEALGEVSVVEVNSRKGENVLVDKVGIDVTYTRDVSTKESDINVTKVVCEDLDTGSVEGEDLDAGSVDGEDLDTGSVGGEDLDAGSDEGEDSDTGSDEGEDSDTDPVDVEGEDSVVGSVESGDLESVDGEDLEPESVEKHTIVKEEGGDGGNVNGDGGNVNGDPELTEEDIRSTEPISEDKRHGKNKKKNRFIKIKKIVKNEHNTDIDKPKSHVSPETEIKPFNIDFRKNKHEGDLGVIPGVEMYRNSEDECEENDDTKYIILRPPFNHK